MPKRINFAAPRTAGDKDLKRFVFLKSAKQVFLDWIYLVKIRLHNFDQV